MAIADASPTLSLKHFRRKERRQNHPYIGGHRHANFSSGLLRLPYRVCERASGQGIQQVDGEVFGKVLQHHRNTVRSRYSQSYRIYGKINIDAGYITEPARISSVWQRNDQEERDDVANR